MILCNRSKRLIYFPKNILDSNGNSFHILNSIRTYFQKHNKICKKLSLNFHSFMTNAMNLSTKLIKSIQNLKQLFVNKLNKSSLTVPLNNLIGNLPTLRLTL